MFILRLVAVVLARAVAEVDGMCLVVVPVGLGSAVLVFVICFSADWLHEARLHRPILCWTVGHDFVGLLAINVLLFLVFGLKGYGVVMPELYIHEVRLSLYSKFAHGTS